MSNAETYSKLVDFIRDNCVHGRTQVVRTSVLAWEFNKVTGLNLSSNAQFPSYMNLYMQQYPSVTKKKVGGYICYCGISLQQRTVIQRDELKQLIMNKFGCTGSQYEYLHTKGLIKSVYTDGFFNEEETIQSTTRSIEAEQKAVISNISAKIRSAKVSAEEYVKSCRYDLIQSILQVDPCYEPTFTNEGDVMLPEGIVDEEVPLVFDNREKMTEICKGELRQIKSLKLDTERLNKLPKLVPYVPPTISPEITSIIETGAKVRSQIRTYVAKERAKERPPCIKQKPHLTLNIIRQ